MCWRCDIEGIRVTEDGKVFDVVTGQLLSDHAAHAGRAVAGRRTDNRKRKARRKAERKARRR